MTLFVVLSILLALAVLAWVLWPLWRVRRLPATLAVALLASCVALLYLLVGTPAAFDRPADTTPRTLAEAIDQLESSLRRDPNQVEGWRLLGRAYAEQRQPVRSRDAFARATAIAPDDDDLQVEYAEARALAEPQRRFDAQGTALLRTVLARNPDHQRARWFLGIAQRQAGEPAAAAATWEPLLARVDAATASALRPQLDAARAEAGLPALAAPTPDDAKPQVATSDGDAAAERHAITVRVALDSAFAARVRLRGDATVFVIARIPGGPPMPVAAERRSVQDLPFELVLDDGDSPMPTQRLSALAEVEVLARISTNGDAARGEGDVESAPVRVGLPATGPVTLMLGR